MTDQDGLHHYEAAPVTHPVACCPELPTDAASAQSANTHLWVLDVADVPYAMELGPWGRKRQSGMLKHSNLTGGEPAYLGGEAWFLDAQTLALNFDSGRYGVWDVSEIPLAEAFVEALVEDGYRVAMPELNPEGKSPYHRYIYQEPVYRVRNNG